MENSIAYEEDILTENLPDKKDIQMADEQVKVSQNEYADEQVAPKEEPSEAPIDYAELEKEDLISLKSEFTEVMYMKSLGELKNPKRYGELRDMGLSPKEAYLASGGRAQKRDNRQHLHSRVPSMARESRMMPEGDLMAAKSIFGDISEAEIIRLYNRVK